MSSRLPSPLLCAHTSALEAEPLRPHPREPEELPLSQPRVQGLDTTALGRVGPRQQPRTQPPLPGHLCSLPRFTSEATVTTRTENTAQGRNRQQDTVWASTHGQWAPGDREPAWGPDKGGVDKRPATRGRLPGESLPPAGQGIESSSFRFKKTIVLMKRQK